MAAGLNVCSASQCAGAFDNGSANVDSGFGVITGLPLAGRVNGPITQGCVPCACNAATKRKNPKPKPAFMLIHYHPFLLRPGTDQKCGCPILSASFAERVGNDKSHPRLPLLFSSTSELPSALA